MSGAHASETTPPNPPFARGGECERPEHHSDSPLC